eukprot:3677310-Rhodomonas_salina.1
MKGERWRRAAARQASTSIDGSLPPSYASSVPRAASNYRDLLPQCRALYRTTLAQHRALYRNMLAQYRALVSGLGLGSCTRKEGAQGRVQRRCGAQAWGPRRRGPA